MTASSPRPNATPPGRYVSAFSPKVLGPSMVTLTTRDKVTFHLCLPLWDCELTHSQDTSCWPLGLWTLYPLDERLMFFFPKAVELTNTAKGFLEVHLQSCPGLEGRMVPNREGMDRVCSTLKPWCWLRGGSCPTPTGAPGLTLGGEARKAGWRRETEREGTLGRAAGLWDKGGSLLGSCLGFELTWFYLE